MDVDTRVAFSNDVYVDTRVAFTNDVDVDTRVAFANDVDVDTRVAFTNDVDVDTRVAFTNDVDVDTRVAFVIGRASGHDNLPTEHWNSTVGLLPDTIVGIFDHALERQEPPVIKRCADISADAGRTDRSTGECTLDSLLSALRKTVSLVVLLRIASQSGLPTSLRIPLTVRESAASTRIGRVSRQ